MRRSEKVTELLTAMNEAKMKIRSLEKNKKNPHFKSEYADINQVFDVIKKPLYENNIALNQFPDIQNGRMVLTTILTHLKSGEFIETDFELLLEKQTSQGQGSALTYAKRLSISTLLSLHEFDDDGNEAEIQVEPTRVYNEGSKREEQNSLPQTTLKSIMTKYVTMYKLDRSENKDALMRVYTDASRLSLAEAEVFVGNVFKETFGEQSTNI